jgi:hypothetical protein
MRRWLANLVSSMYRATCLRTKPCSVESLPIIAPSARQDVIGRPVTSLEDGANVEDSPGRKEATDGDKSCQETSPSPFTPGELIIAHSKVYTFAKQFFCSNLENLALNHLTLVLQSADSQAHNLLPGLIDAACHVYDNTQERASGPDPLRSLLVQCLVKNLSVLNDDFDILASESEVIRDVFRELLKRATTAEQELAPLKRECTQKDNEIRQLKGSRCKKCRQSSFEYTWES